MLKGNQESAKMSKGQTLRALVNERLAAAADEIFALFEKTIAEYEEELRCSKVEQNMQLQESVLRFRVPLEEEALAKTPSPTTDPKLNHEITENDIKGEPDEHCVKQEEEQLPLSFLESSADCVKSENSSQLEQRQTDHKEGSHGEDISSEPQCQSLSRVDTDHSSDSDNSDLWEPRPSWSSEQMETEVFGDPYNIQITDINTQLPTQSYSVPMTSVANKGMSGPSEGGPDMNQCSVCQKRFKSNLNLQKHIKVHSEVMPYSCQFCNQTFTRKFRLQGHMRRTHANEKPYSCSICKKTFGRMDILRGHVRTHTGEKPYKCLICKKAFADSSTLATHKRIHTGEKPYSCTICNKKYGQKNCLKEHMRTHTKECDYSCPLCGKSFGKKSYLDIHMRCHTGEKPYICSICFHPFSVNSNLTRHMKRHEEAKRIAELN